MPIAAELVPPAVYNVLVTLVTGGVSMVIFFFVFKIIFPEGESDKKENETAFKVAQNNQRYILCKVPKIKKILPK